MKISRSPIFGRARGKRSTAISPLTPNTNMTTKPRGKTCSAPPELTFPLSRSRCRGCSMTKKGASLIDGFLRTVHTSESARGIESLSLCVDTAYSQSDPRPFGESSPHANSDSSGEESHQGKGENLQQQQQQRTAIPANSRCAHERRRALMFAAMESYKEGKN